MDNLLRQYSIQFDGIGAGPYEYDEIRHVLLSYRDEHPNDTEFTGVVIWELPSEDGAAKRRRAWDFL